MVGGPSIILHCYHNVKKTKTRKHDMKSSLKSVRKLYIMTQMCSPLGQFMQDMPMGLLRTKIYNGRHWPQYASLCRKSHPHASSTQKSDCKLLWLKYPLSHSPHQMVPWTWAGVHSTLYTPVKKLFHKHLFCLFLLFSFLYFRKKKHKGMAFVAFLAPVALQNWT